MTLRETVANLMVARHGISRELAVHHAERMSQSELQERFRMYARSSGAELSAVGPKTEPVNVSSTRFSRPATMTAGPRHSTLFPRSGTSLPDSEVENRGKLAP